MSVEQRFWSKVQKGEGCWLWIGMKTAKGYGHFTVGRKPWQAHRWAYTHCVGEIEAGLTLDHLCRVRSCVNPDHLEPVTKGENSRRGVGFAGTNVVKTHCAQGHPYTEGNIRPRVRRRDGYIAHERRCRACEIEYKRAKRAKCADVLHEGDGL